MTHNEHKDSLSYPQDSKTGSIFLGIGTLGLLASIVGYFLDKEQFYFSYLTSFAFIASIGLGSLFFVMLQHVTRSEWSVVLRRVPETFASNIWILAILFIPVIFGLHTLYHWTHEDAVAVDKLLQDKAPYLNEPFYIIRQVFFFGLWSFLGWKLYKTSVDQDASGDWGLQTLQRKIAAPGIFLFGFTIAFASFDWLMSLDPHWFSTMFGVYYFAMTFQVFFPITILVFLHLHSKNLLTNTVQTTHLQDLGKLFFGFTVFYAYIAFSQYMLIYYANIPEETLWFYHRFEGNYKYVAFLILFGRFVFPFLALLNMNAKRNQTILKYVSIWIVFVHFVELYWIVMPTHHTHDLHFHWLDVTTFLGLAGLFVGLFFRKFGSANMIPSNDPLLEKSLHKH